MNITHIADIAELLSAFAAILTVGLAFIELTFRSKAKRADIAMNIYADFLYTKQQLAYAVGSVQSFARNVGRCSETVLISFCRTHAIDPSIFTTIHTLTKESITNAERLTQKEKTRSKLVLDLSGKTTDLLLYINAFFQAYAAGGPYDSADIEKSCQHVTATYEELLPQLEAAGSVLKTNLKKMHSSSNLYISVLLVAAVVLLGICFLL